MNPLVVIPARGGSKGVPGKNIKILHGKPLIQYTIDAAKAIFPDDVICVSTDDMEIRSVVETGGLRVPFVRPPELATDTAGTYEVLLHALSHYEQIGYHADTVILLQATSPFRNSKHIAGALRLMDENTEMVVSVKETSSNPYYVLYEENEEGFLQKSKAGNFSRRQDCPKVWEYNGAIYIINVEAMKQAPIHQLKRVKKFVMNEISSHDIDTMLDWEIAELIASKKYAE